MLGNFGQVLVDDTVVLLLRVLVTLGLVTRATTAALVLGLVLQQLVTFAGRCEVFCTIFSMPGDLPLHTAAMASLFPADRVLLHLFERFAKSRIVNHKYLHLSAVRLL